MPGADKKKKLSVHVEETLRYRILNFEYPHNHLLVEEALCQEFGVSRSPVREALRMLESSGMIHRMKNRSYVVKQISQTDVKELYELRLALEKHVVEKLCQQEDSDQLVQLLLYWQNLDFGDGKDLAVLDRDFHESLAEIYGNKAILDELVHINERIWVFRQVDTAKKNRMKSTQEQHLNLLKAIHSGNVADALHYIEININEGLGNAIETLKEAILRAYER